MKKIFTLLILLFSTAYIFSYDRDYTQIQKTQSKQEGQKFIFRDVFKKEFTTVINPNIPKNEYKKENFIHSKDNLSYKSDGKYTSKQGVDISRHDGIIDWKKLKQNGISFVILRIGYRGYQSGKLNLDENFYKNIEGAQKEGLEIGVYVFSQAKDEKETLEEANLVITALKNYKITLPVFYDPEIIRNDKARSDNITGEQFTKNTITFCEKLKQAGYKTGIYANMLWQAYELDLTKFSDYYIWYADYESVPQSPYRFEFWQYAEKDGEAKAPYDMDIMLLPTN